MKEEPKPPLPPFSYEEAVIKVRKAEDAWNGKNPAAIALAYTPDSKWRNRSLIFEGREAIEAFFVGKWERELEYRLIKEIWTHSANRIAVRFAYEWHDAEGNWFRSYGNENWEFAEDGRMAVRHASINDLAISEADRKFLWEGDKRPDDYPSLTDFGL